MEYNFTLHKKPKPANAEYCQFGKVFTDHMLTISWKAEGGWNRPLIQPFGKICLHPASSVFHYAVEVRLLVQCFNFSQQIILKLLPILCKSAQ